MQTTQDKHYLCCQRVARLEVSLAKEVTGSDGLRYLATSPLHEFDFVALVNQIPKPFTNL